MEDNFFFFLNGSYGRQLHDQKPSSKISRSPYRKGTKDSIDSDQLDDKTVIPIDSRDPSQEQYNATNSLRF